jgi:hypothetical protein
MTTSEPRTPHDDTPREHRRLGQRILDAVLGDPADTRPDDPATPAAATRTAPKAAPARRASPATGRAATTPRTSRPSAIPPTAGPSGTTGPLRRGTSPRPRTPATCRPTLCTTWPGRAHQPGRRPPRRRAPRRRRRVRRSSGRGPGRLRRPERGRPRHRVRPTPGRGPGRRRRPERRRIRRPGRGRPGGHHRGPAGLRPARFPRRRSTGRGARPSPFGRRHRGDDRDLVTSSYDPDRDTGYDPHAAGTAMGSAAGAGAAGVADRGRPGRHGLRTRPATPVTWMTRAGAGLVTTTPRRTPATSTPPAPRRTGPPAAGTTTSTPAGSTPAAPTSAGPTRPRPGCG